METNKNVRAAGIQLYFPTTKGKEIWRIWTIYKDGAEDQYYVKSYEDAEIELDKIINQK